MCDYSLERVASRAAKVGDRLVTTQFALAQNVRRIRPGSSPAPNILHRLNHGGRASVDCDDKNIDSPIMGTRDPMGAAAAAIERVQLCLEQQQAI